MLNELYQLFKPYFQLTTKSFHFLLTGLGILLGNLFAAFIYVAINQAFNSLLGVLAAPGLTYAIFFKHVLECLGVIVVYSSTRVITWALSSWLGDKLSYEINRDLITQWIDKKSFYGIKFVDGAQNKPVNAANVLGSDVKIIAKYSSMLTESFIGKFFNFIIGAYHLWHLSSPMTFFVFSTAITIPGTMFIGAVVYALGYHALVTYFDQKLKQQNTQLREKEDTFIAHLHHVNEHGEAIALKMGEPKEKESLHHNLDRYASIRSENRKTSGLLKFIESIHQQLSFMFGLALSAPGIIAGVLEGTMAFSLSSYFSNIVEFFTWKKDRTEDITALEVSLNRLTAFKNLMHEWEQIDSARELKVHLSDNLQAKDMSIQKPDGAAILHRVSFQLPKGQATLIKGESGIGKSTLFRSLAQLWPYVNGELILPKKGEDKDIHVYYIPQQTYFPYHGTLLDAILYPQGKGDAKKEARVVALMRELGFKEEAITNLNTHDEWDKRLSGGEQQRIAIIGAIMQNPEILFIDEGTSALDHDTKIKVENCLKRELVGTTIVAIDHNPLSPHEGYTPFFSNTLLMTKRPQEAHTKVQLKCF